MTRGVTIANNGAMPFDGWALLCSHAWGSQTQTSNNWISGYINDVLIVDSNVSYGVGVGINNTDSALVPVKAGDVFKYVIRAEGNNAKGCSCILYPYEAAPEEETEV